MGTSAIAAIVLLSCQHVERVQEATGSTIPHIVAALHIATALPPIDLAVSHAVTHSHGDNRAPDNSLAGKVAISRALDPAAVASAIAPQGPAWATVAVDSAIHRWEGDPTELEAVIFPAAAAGIATPSAEALGAMTARVRAAVAAEAPPVSDLEAAEDSVEAVAAALEVVDDAGSAGSQTRNCWSTK